MNSKACHVPLFMNFVRLSRINKESNIFLIYGIKYLCWSLKNIFYLDILFNFLDHMIDKMYNSKKIRKR